MVIIGEQQIHVIYRISKPSHSRSKCLCHRILSYLLLADRYVQEWVFYILYRTSASFQTLILILRVSSCKNKKWDECIDCIGFGIILELLLAGDLPAIELGYRYRAYLSRFPSSRTSHVCMCVCVGGKSETHIFHLFYSRACLPSLRSTSHKYLL